MPALRIAVVGAGARAQAHLTTIGQLHDLYTLTGIADADGVRRELVATQYGVPGFATVDALLDTTHPDLLFVIVPPDGHHVMTEAAARRGVHVVSEVPIATTLGMADAMIGTARRHQIKLEVAENVWRWPAERLKRRIVEEGLIGRVTQAHLWYASGSYHGLSAVRSIIQAAPTRALGVARDVEGPERPDLMGQPNRLHPWELGVIEFAGGATCVYQQPIHRARSNYWEIVGTDGYIAGNELVIERGERRRYPIESVMEEQGGKQVLAAVRVATDPPLVWENPYRRYGLAAADDVARADVLAGMHAAITQGTEPPYGGQEARTDQEVLLALRESARLGSTWIDLPLQAPTGLERSIHETYRAKYGRDPLEEAATLATTTYPRQGVSQYLHHPDGAR
ncbi:MAG: Gfo/Idh/MocA family protein [Chloroflexota bacterium]